MVAGIDLPAFFVLFSSNQKRIRDAQVERAENMIKSGKLKKNRKNPNDPARFVEKLAVTKDGEKADIKYYLDEDKIANEEMYDGLYAPLQTHKTYR